MIRNDTRLVNRISILRWAIPLLVSGVGLGYMVFDHYVVDGRRLSAPYVFSSILIFGLVGPIFAWVTLDWAERAARAEATAQMEMRQQFEAMRVLHDISLVVTSRLETREVLAAILAQGVRLLQAKASSLSLYDPSTGQVRLIAVHNLPAEYEGMSLRLSEGAIGRVVQTGKPLIVNDYRHWEGRYPPFESSSYDAIISAPLRWNDQVFAVLNVMDRAEQHRFDKQDLQRLILFVDFASIAFKNAELYAQVVKLGESLEQKVEERTGELAGAKEELTRKAEQLQQALAETVRIQEQERDRIARDLHDGSNQLITGATYEIQAALESLLRGGQETALHKLEKAKALLRRLAEENRRIIFDLRPPILNVQGLVPALRWLADMFRRQHHIPCSFRVTGKPARLLPTAETAIYRIVQESLNNASAHAQAKHVLVAATFAATGVCIVVEDDGLGFETDRVAGVVAGHMGLIGMHERAQSINGQLTVESLPGHGTRITLVLPLEGGPSPSQELALNRETHDANFSQSTA
jgi:signal transduction histidine kinase